MGKKYLGPEYEKIIIETEGDQPKTIAIITDGCIQVGADFWVRLTPRHPEKKEISVTGTEKIKE
jgi:hypothetical protein